MPATIATARDEMSALFKAAWDTTGLPVIWDDVAKTPPKTRTGWARFTIRHEDGDQSTLSGGLGKARFTRRGTIFIQIFTPVGKGLSDADPLIKKAMDAYEGKSTASGVWFRNVRPREIGPDGDWNQVNVLADFEYDEVK